MTEVVNRARSVARDATAPVEAPFSERTRRRVGYALLAALAYLPVLLTHPGKVAADTKTYLYLDPGRLLSRAPTMWDPNIGLGTVTHQTIGYLFPMGPFYWLLETGLGLPSWAAQRLWLGTLLFTAALGMLFLLRTLGVRGPGAPVGALAFMLTPYVLDYSARISVILGPWAALPWMVGLIVLALRHGGWRYPALFAVVVQLVGGVNATALLFAGIAPVLWIPYSVWVTRETTWRRAVGVLWRTGLLTLLTSLWWIAGLWSQGKYGLDILKFTETIEAVSKTSFPGEILRGLGYWFFYGQDKVGPWTESAANYTQQIPLILLSYALPTLALLAAVVIRWRYKTYFMLLVLIGVAIAVGASPYADPSPVGAVFKSFANNSSAGLALRSTGRAVPLVVLGIATFLACGVNAVADALRGRGLPRRGVVVASVVGAMIIVNFPALWDGTYYGKNLERPEAIPQYWKDVIRYLDAQPHDTRILEIPGADFASYRWGNTVDPITPGLTNRPYVARELIPWGSPPSADLLNALDRQLQESLLDPAGVASVARLMSVGDVTLRMDIQTDRYDLIRPRLLWDMFRTPPPGLGDPKTFGTSIPGTSKFPRIDERALTLPVEQSQPPPVATLHVDNPTPIIRATPSAQPVVIAGSGEGLVDVASLGLADANRPIFYSASYSGDLAKLRARIGSDATLVVTDTNRQQARRWSTVRDNLGYTEQAGQTPLVQDLGDARLEVFPGAPASAFTVMEQRGVRSVQASHYGNPVSYTGEDRAARALDGELFTSWKVGAFANVDGEKLKIDLDHAITTDHVNLVQPLNGPRDRYITKITLIFDGKYKVSRTLGPDSRDLSGKGETVTFPKRRFSTLEIRIDGTNVSRRFAYGGVSAVGFSEIRLRDDRPGSSDVRVDEVVRMPTDLLGAAGTSSLQHPLVIAMTRDRQYPTPPRYDPELHLVREFSLPTDRSFALSGTVRMNPTAPDDLIDRLLGIPGADQGGITAVSSQYLDGNPRARASSAFDGDATTAWSTKFATPVGQWVQVTTPQPITFDHLDLRVVADGRHSVPTKLQLTSDDGTSRTIDVPAIADQATPNATTAVPVNFPAVSGRTFRITILDVRAVHTLEYYSAAEMTMPVAIAEAGIPGVRRASGPAQLSDVCRTDLLSIDGRPVGIRLLGTTAAAETYGTLRLELCTADGRLSLGPGPHVLRTPEGNASGFDFDQVVLSSAAGGAATPVGGLVASTSAGPGAGGPGAARPTLRGGMGAPAIKVVRQGRTSATLHADNVSGPFWLVLGQSQNKGWVAKADGKSLGPPELIDGYANGWLVTPSAPGRPVNLTLDWTPQHTVWLAIVLSAAAALVCLGLIVATTRSGRRRRDGAPVPTPSPETAAFGPMQPELTSPTAVETHRVSGPAIAATTLVTAVVGGALIRPWCALLTGGLVLLVMLRPRWRVALRLSPFVALGLCGLYAGVSQFVYHLKPIFEWPTQLWRVRTLGWLAVALLACEAIVEIVSRREPLEAHEAGAPVTRDA